MRRDSPAQSLQIIERCSSPRDSAIVLPSSRVRIEQFFFVLFHQTRSASHILPWLGREWSANREMLRRQPGQPASLFACRLPHATDHVVSVRGVDVFDGAGRA